MESKERFKLIAKCALAVFLMLFMAQCKQPKDTTNTARSVIGKSNFIFLGTIVKMDASNIGIKTNDRTAIVTVDEVLDAVPPYDLMKGKEITVLLAPNNKHSAGEKEVFYTRGWYYGKTLGVKEIPNNLTKETMTVLKQKIAQERMNIVNDSLRAELNRAKLVVQGVVIETDVKDEKYPSYKTEHDPKFRKAVIEIRNVLKGDFSEKHVDVYYASSDDVMWSVAPKLTKNQEGIFLLHLNQAPSMFKMRGYTILDKRDVQTNENLENIKNLLSRKR